MIYVVEAADMTLQPLAGTSVPDFTDPYGHPLCERHFLTVRLHVAEITRSAIGD